MPIFVALLEKPFAIGELMARLRAALRRAAHEGREQTRTETKRLCIDFVNDSLRKIASW
jgi:DNA-binding response OmpR family regulator